MQRYTPPVIPGVALEPAPAPWEALPRIAPGIYEYFELVREGRKAEADLSKNYYDWWKKRYLIPAVIASALPHLFDQMPGSENAEFTVHSTEEEHEASVAKFENDYLELPPNLGGSIRWWRSNAGASGGSYPIEPVAERLGMAAADLHEYIVANQNPGGYVAARSDEWFYAMRSRARGDKPVTAINLDGIQELTPLGIQRLDLVLATFSEAKQLSERGARF